MTASEPGSPPDEPPIETSRSWSESLLRSAPALRSRNFRLFWGGQLVSTIGTSLQVVAEGWLIYSITESTFWLGMVGLLALIPVLPISLLGGVLIDRVPRRRLILATQSGLMLQALIFGILAVTGHLQLWSVIALYFVFGSLLAIDHPARRAFLVELVPEEDLANAVALNATLFNLSSLIGYAAAGLLIATVGAGVTMLINSLTYMATIGSLLLIRVPDTVADKPPPEGEQQSFIQVISEGAMTLWKDPAILGTISLMAVVGGLTWPVFGMMPAYAEEVMHTGAMGLGILMSAGAFGSILGTIIVARLGASNRGRTMTVVSLTLPLLVIAFAFAPGMVVASLLLIAIGALLLILQSIAITLVQVNIPDRVRGRVMSIYSILHAGSDTMGNVAVGTLAVYIGLPLSLASAGLLAFVYATGLRSAMPSVDKLD
jgi:MFS family permease